jgi:hypothetical protein
MSAHNQSLLFLLIFTIVSSAFAYHLVVKAYDTVLATSAFELSE